MIKAWGGIDPGKQGWVALMQDIGRWKTWPTPQKNGEYDEHTMLDILEFLYQANVRIVCIELVRSFPGLASKSTIQMGYGAGLWSMAILSSQMEKQVVSSRAWRKEMGLVIYPPKVGKKATPEEKKIGYQMRKQASIDFVKKELGYITKNDGEAEALILAMYAQRKFP